MAVLGVIGSILLGISVIAGLMKDGEMGCVGGLFIFVLVVILIAILGVGFLVAVGGMM